MIFNENSTRNRNELVAEYERLKIEYKDRKVLNVEAQIYLPEKQKVDMKIEITGENLYREASTSRIKYPFKDKAMAAGVVMYSRLHSKEIVPFTFTDEEFKRIREVKIRWFVKDTGEVAMMSYPVVFTDSEGEKSYTLRSCCYAMAGAVASPEMLSTVLEKSKLHYDEAIFAARSNGKLMLLSADDGLIDGVEIEDTLKVPNNISGLFLFKKHVELTPAVG